MIHNIVYDQVRDTYGARVIFPAPGDDQPDVVVLVGKKENVEKAQQQLMEQIKELVSLLLPVGFLLVGLSSLNTVCYIFNRRTSRSLLLLLK